MYGVYDCWLIYGNFILPCHTDEHLCIPCYPLHSAFLAGFCYNGLNRCLVFLGWSTPAATLLSAARDENLPQPPSLAEVMLEAERNKRETNRLLERIE